MIGISSPPANGRVTDTMQRRKGATPQHSSCQQTWLAEIFQPLRTPEDGLVRNQLDRFETNQHYVDTLHKEVSAWTTHFPYDLTHHRLVCTHRRTKAAKTALPGCHSPAPMQGMCRLSIQQRVEEAWEIKAPKLLHLSPLERLQHYKATLRRIAHELAEKAGDWQPLLCEDRINISAGGWICQTRF